ncbi:P-loop containing nucleoside triphosphate hydrolase protein [Abortiporus biennis]|nr:P-loop containing nucleoside triphosphate hydrolase protein [Abortiporus biennis]
MGDSEVKISSVDSGYAKRRKQHLGLINQLRAIGAQADLDLPRIAVIGNQSAGKSSLVEAISGINVPRDAGTCTRCPMECRLAQSSGAWQCQVSIRWEFNADGNPKDEVREELFGPTLTNKSDVELALRRAQAAILNPNVAGSKFVNFTAEELKSVAQKNSLLFSRNAVCVDLSGPELTDLAFVDLPGIIQNAAPATVQLVEDLVLSHIKGNCLILVTLPMSDDIENQKAMRLAQQEDPSGIRTIGVMTKPDTLTSGATKARDLWLDVLEGRRFSLRHGYYCTRQPDDDERSQGITTQQARVAEQVFFAKTSPWSKSTQQNRFGTNNLVASLSKLLTQVIDDTLPKLQGEVTKQLTACTSRLGVLPPPITTEPSAYVLNLVTEFCQKVKLYIKGHADYADLVQENRRIYAAYKYDIRSSAPQLLPFVDRHDIATTKLKGFLDLDDDEYLPPADTSQSTFMFLGDVRQHIEKSLTRELPHNVPYAAKVSLIQKFQSSWGLDSQRCFDSIFRALDKTLGGLIGEDFNRYDNLRARVQSAAMELIRLKRAETLKVIQRSLINEKSPYTQNDHYMQVTKDKYLAKYKDARAGKSLLIEPSGSAAKRQRVSSQAHVTPEPSDASQPTPSPQKSTTATTSNGRPISTPNSANRKVAPLPKRVIGGQAYPPPNPQSGVLTPTSPEDVEMDPNNDSDASIRSGSQQPPHGLGPKKHPFLDEDELQAIRNETLSLLAKLGHTDITVADLGKLNPPDIYERELDVMAEVRAYFHVAYKRVIDNIPMNIDNWFLFPFADELQGFLIAKLGLGASNATSRCSAFLTEDPNIVAERDDLINRKKRLESVQQELYNFGL